MKKLIIAFLFVAQVSFAQDKVHYSHVKESVNGYEKRRVEFGWFQLFPDRVVQFDGENIGTMWYTTNYFEIGEGVKAAKVNFKKGNSDLLFVVSYVDREFNIFVFFTDKNGDPVDNLFLKYEVYDAEVR